MRLSGLVRYGKKLFIPAGSRVDKAALRVLRKAQRLVYDPSSFTLTNSRVVHAVKRSQLFGAKAAHLQGRFKRRVGIGLGTTAASIGAGMLAWKQGKKLGHAINRKLRIQQRY